ncbi:hypothetical protein [Paraurantiacibacter namhicola]|uniref:Uncharacterized protein n=1 Tax=Paraurantiacibacter namhicola TaxID=645517 RepID=A0A1C7D795_9SPHN|nr:hypothetical protein [Paraurantiacibacter namhicola]ANU07173.1 hypothetical protein A6F65_00856 [Paraurantiacibacter namhicola]
MGTWSSVKQAFNAKRAIKDFANEWQRPNPHRWGVLGVSVALTFAVMMLFIPKTERGVEPKPDITYITSWADGRSDAEIVASNIENQRRKDERAALLERRAERRKELYRELGRATGIDVDEVERQIAREEAEARAAAEAGETPAATPATGDTGGE